jgi:hypothetical protein
MTFLFWNLNRKSLTARAAEIATTHDADILILAECFDRPSAVLRSLNSGEEVRWAFASTPLTPFVNLQLYVRGAASFIKPKYELPRASIREIQFPGPVV